MWEKSPVARKKYLSVSEIEKLAKSRKLYRWAKKYVIGDGGTVEQAKDLLQRTLCKLLEKERAGAAVQDYVGLFKVMFMRRWARERQQERKRPSLLEIRIFIDQWTEKTETDNEYQELADIALAHVRQMDHVCARLLYLVYWENKTYEDIRIDNVFPDVEEPKWATWVKNRKHKCLRRLRKMLRADPKFKRYFKS